MSRVESVPLLDPKRANAELSAALKQACERVIDSGRYILGEEVECFERECARYIGAQYALGVSSGTDALLVALIAHDIGPGDEVICPTYTFFATAGSVWRVGAKPVFVDSCSPCFNCDPKQVLAKITERTRAIIPVHLFGQSAEMGPILDAARERGIAVIEDAAQAIGAAYGECRVGSLGDAGCFSFFPSKNLGGFGDAGLVTTSDAALYEKMVSLRNHGAKNRYEHPLVGGNFRIDALQAALLRVKLPLVEQYAEARRANAAYYDELFLDSGLAVHTPTNAACSARCGSHEERDASLLLPVACRGIHVFNQYVVRVPGEGRRDALLDALAAAKVGCAVYYPTPLHLQPCFASLGHERGDFPVAEQAALESIALPIFSELTRDEIERVVDVVVRFLRCESA